MNRRSMICSTSGIAFSAALAGLWRSPSMAVAKTATPASAGRLATDVELLIGGYDSPEGPAFDRDGNLFFVNWQSSSIIKLTPDGIASEFFNTGGIPAGLAFHRDGSLYVADEGANVHGILRITPGGEVATVVNEYQGRPLNGCNDLVFDRDGALFFSDPWDTPSGDFYRLSADGGLERIDTGLTFPNGVAITPNGSAVVLAEASAQRLLRYEIDADGSPGPREVWVQFEDAGDPDGLEFDVEGNLYVARYGGGRIDVLDPHGVKIDEIRVPGANPTNLAFGGPDNKTLVITEIETGSLYQVRLNVAGQHLNDGRT